MCRSKLACLLAAGIIALSIACVSNAKSEDFSNAKDILEKKVEVYSNGGLPLIPTLIEIAAAYHLPMGIEKVTPDALYTPIHVNLSRMQLQDILTRCLQQVPGYSWSVQQGAIDIYGEEERTNQSNLFNYRVPMLDIQGGDLNLVNALLRRSVPQTTTVAHHKEPSVPGGSFGDSPGIGGLESPHVNFEARQETVRSILNRIVVLSKSQVIWIARVPPSELSHRPSQGLWLLSPPVPDLISSLDLILLPKPKG